MILRSSYIQGFVVGLSLLSLSSSAQLLEGKVTEPSGVPVPDAHVRMLNTNLGTTTDAQGIFTMEGIHQGKRLVISAIGFATTEVVVSDTTRMVILEPASLLLNSQVTVTAMRTEMPVFNTKESVTLVKGEDILQNQSRTAPEAMIGSTGIWVQKTNHGGGSPIIRGLVGNQILLMVDGIRMNNATYRYGPNQYMALLDPGMIAQLEATRGGGSVLYGSDALGGVINVLSRTPGFSNEGFQVKGNAFGRWMTSGMESSGRVELAMSGKRTAMVGGFSARDYGELLAGGSWGTLNPTGYYEHSGDLKVLTRTGRTGVMTFAYQHHQQNAVPRYDQVAYGGYADWKFNPQARQLAYGRWESGSGKNIAENIRITGIWGRNTEGVRSQKQHSAEIRNMRDVVDTWGVTFEVQSRFKEHWKAQSGVEYYHDKVNSSASERDVNGQEIPIRGNYADGSTMNNLAVFSNHTITADRFEFSGGARFNVVDVRVSDPTFGSQSITPNALVGNVGVTYSVHPSHKIILDVNTGFRAPNVDDMSKFGAVEATVFEVPSSDLSPERSLSIEAGMKSSMERLSATVSIYHTQLNDLIDRVPVVWEGQDSIENRKVYQKQNVGEARLFGAEASLDWMARPSLFFYGNLTYTYGDNKTKNEPMRRIPPLFGKLGVKYGKSTGFWGKVEWLLAGEQSRLAKGDLADARISARLEDGVAPAWNVVNLFAGYNFRKYGINVALQNIFNSPYRVYASGVDGVGRSAMITLSAGF